MLIQREINASMIEQLQAGDETAFKSIYDLLHEQMYALIFSLVKDKEQSEDILQETFIVLWVNKEKLSAQQSLVPYLYVTARRLTIDAFRKKATETNFKQSLGFDLKESDDGTEQHILLNDLQHFTDEVIRELPSRQQLIFRMSRYEGLSYDEIADRLQISRNTVKNHLVNALRTLRMVLSKNVISLLICAGLSFFVF